MSIWIIRIKLFRRSPQTLFDLIMIVSKVIPMTGNDTKKIGDEFIEEDETTINPEEQALEGLYDLVLPPGIPQKIIMEVMDKFNLEVATRKCSVQTIDVESDNLLTLRGELDSVNNAHDYIYKKLSEKYNYRR